LNGGTSADELISSVVVKGDFQLVLYEHPYYRGNKLVLTADEPYLTDQSYNDIASSLKVVATGGSETLTFGQFASIATPSGDYFQEFEDLAIGDVVDTGGTGYLELIMADAGDILYVYQYDGAGSMTNPTTFDTRVIFGQGVGFDRFQENEEWMYGDRIACGDFADATGTIKDGSGNYLGDYKDEIILLDQNADRVRIFDPRSTSSDKVLSDFAYSTGPGDSLGTGNLDGSFPGWEFAVAHGDDNLRIRYGDNAIAEPDRGFFFDRGDQMAVGDLDQDNRAEVVYLRHGTVSSYVGEILIIDAGTGSAVGTYSPPVDLEPWDSITVGDVNGDGIGEIIWGSGTPTGGGDIRILSWDSVNGGVTQNGIINGVYKRGDRIVAGDLNGDGVAEIAHGRNNTTSDGTIVIYTMQ
jgi:hypothetical protein